MKGLPLDPTTIALRRAQMGRGAIPIMRWGPQPIIDEGEGYWMALSGSPSADLNVALVSSAEPATLAGVLERVIASGLPTLFMVGGDCRSTELPSPWQHVGDMPFMSLELDSADIYTDSRVRQATNDDVDDVCSVIGEAFGLSTALLHDPIAHVLNDITGPMKIWLLIQDNIAVSCVLTSTIDDAVTVWCMSTPERFARRGYGRAILADVMQRSKANTVYLSVHDRWNSIRWSWGIRVLGSLYSVVGHLSFDDARVRAMASGRKKFKEKF